MLRFRPKPGYFTEIRIHDLLPVPPPKKPAAAGSPRSAPAPGPSAASARRLVWWHLAGDGRGACPCPHPGGRDLGRGGRTLLSGRSALQTL